MNRETGLANKLTKNRYYSTPTKTRRNFIDQLQNSLHKESG
jgi:hypothetical protein